MVLETSRPRAAREKPLLDERAEAGSTKDQKKREGTSRQHKECGESTQHKAEENLMDYQMQNNVMFRSRTT